MRVADRTRRFVLLVFSLGVLSWLAGVGEHWGLWSIAGGILGWMAIHAPPGSTGTEFSSEQAASGLGGLWSR